MLAIPKLKFSFSIGVTSLIRISPFLSIVTCNCLPAFSLIIEITSEALFVWVSPIFTILSPDLSPALTAAPPPDTILISFVAFPVCSSTLKAIPIFPILFTTLSSVTDFNSPSCKYSMVTLSPYATSWFVRSASMLVLFPFIACIVSPTLTPAWSRTEFSAKPVILVVAVLYENAILKNITTARTAFIKTPATKISIFLYQLIFANECSLWELPSSPSIAQYPPSGIHLNEYIVSPNFFWNIFGPKPIANSFTWTLNSFETKKCPNSCTVATAHIINNNLTIVIKNDNKYTTSILYINIYTFKIIYTKGATNIMLSHLSKIPPWPGII